MKIIAFAGSNSKNSINKQLVTYVSSLFETAQSEILDLNDFELPVYGIDIETEKGIPETTTQFANKLSAADLILVSLAEHNGSYSAVFKNLYDWVSRIPERKVFDNKPLFLLATSPGARGGAGVLEAAEVRFPRDGANLLGVFSFPSFYDNFKDGEISNPELKAKMIEKVKEITAQLQ